MTIGIAGAGHMGGAILRGLAASPQKPALRVFDSDAARASALAAETGADPAPDAAACAAGCDAVVCAVRPGDMPGLLAALVPAATPFAASSAKTNAPGRLPSTRSTFVAPMFPLPAWRMSMPCASPTSHPNGIDPSR